MNVQTKKRGFRSLTVGNLVANLPPLLNIFEPILASCFATMGRYTQTARKSTGGKPPRRQLAVRASAPISSNAFSDSNSDSNSDGAGVISATTPRGVSKPANPLKEMTRLYPTEAELARRFLSYDVITDAKPEILPNPFRLSTRLGLPGTWQNPYGEGNEPWLSAGNLIGDSVLDVTMPGTSAAAAIELSLRADTALDCSDGRKSRSTALAPKKVIGKKRL